MPETPTTVVHPPNGLSKDSPSMILQQVGRIPKELQECRSLQDALHSSIVTVAATGVVSRCSQVSRSCRISNLEQFLQRFHLRRIWCEPVHFIQSKRSCMPTLCKTVIEFAVSWDAIYRPRRFLPQMINCIPTSTSFNNLYLLQTLYSYKHTILWHVHTV